MNAADSDRSSFVSARSNGIDPYEPNRKSKGSKGEADRQRDSKDKKWIGYALGACFGFAACNASISEITE